MRQEIEVFDYANDILKAVKTGVLLTTKADDKVNSMTISWGTLGIEWAKPIFTFYIKKTALQEVS
jgi:flavin reductase (DIM6/NTAB) family NADH-FMN oxidoreductase RutF